MIALSPAVISSFPSSFSESFRTTLLPARTLTDWGAETLRKPSPSLPESVTLPPDSKSRVVTSILANIISSVSSISASFVSMLAEVIEVSIFTVPSTAVFISKLFADITVPESPSSITDPAESIFTLPLPVEIIPTPLISPPIVVKVISLFVLV